VSIAGVTGDHLTRGVSSGEYLAKLAGSYGRTVFNEMRLGDAQIKAGLSTIGLPIRQIEYTVEPASDDPKDVKIAETVESNLFNMSVTWDDVIRNFLLMLPFGVSCAEKVYEKGDDGKIRIAKLDPRLPQSFLDNTFWEWNPDKSLKAIVQMDGDGKRYTLPVEKLLIFTNEKEGDNWEGVSLLRSIYGMWRIKNDLLKINVINLDKNGVGVPDVEMPPGITPESKEWKATEDVLEAYCANEKAYIVRPAGSKIQILTGGKDTPDTLASIKFCNEEISREMLVQFINLGSTQTGSRALGSSFIDFFLMAEQAIADYFCEVINKFLIQELVDFNWTVKEYPKLKAARIRQLDPTVMAELSKAGLITPDLDTENAIRKQERLPERVEEVAVVPPVPVNGMPPAQAAESDEGTPAEGQIDEQCQKSGDEKTKTVDKKKEIKIKASTATPDFLKYIDVEGMTIRLNAASESFSKQIIAMKEQQRAAVIKQLIEGKAVNQVTVPLKKEMYELSMQAFRENYKAGSQDVLNELKKQGLKQSPATLTPGLADAESLYAEELQLAIQGASQKLVQMLAEERLIARRAGRIGRDAAMDLAKLDISNRNWTDIENGAVNRGWGEGREDMAQAEADQIEYGTYTSVMEAGTTCDECASKDNVEHAVDDEEYQTPNPQCYGGADLCRCMTAWTFKSESMSEADYAELKGGQ
jgi:hypothetical protein